jgi:hypothetical protein
MSMSQANHVGGLFGRINQTGYTSKTARMPVNYSSSVQLRNNAKQGGVWMLSAAQREAIAQREAREDALKRTEKRNEFGLIVPVGQRAVLKGVLPQSDNDW